MRLIQLPSSRQTTPQSIRFAFVTIYTTILCGVIYFYSLVWSSTDAPGSGNASLVIALVLLLGLERLEQRRFGYDAPMVIVIGLLLARIALIEFIVALDTLGAGMFLYPIVSFSAYYGLGGGWSRLISAGYLLLTIVRASHVNPTWFRDPTTTALLMGFALAIVFIQMMAYILRREEESRRRMENLLSDLEMSNLKLQVYAAQVGELAASEERNRLARDIHDSLGHYLTAVNIQLEKALAYHDRDPAQAMAAIQEAKDAAAEALKDVRRSVGALRDADAPFSLQDALKDLLPGMNDEHLTVTLTFAGDEAGYSRPALMTLYRAAQEGLTNIRKHAQARHVTLDVHLGECQASLLLRDDGLGFDADGRLPLPRDDESSEAVREPGRPRFGLQGIRERVELVSGQMALRSAPHTGTELCVTVPKNPNRLVGGDWLNLHVSRGK